MTNSNSYTWQDGFKIFLAVMTFGAGWIVDNQSTVIAFLAIAIVWFVSLLMKRYQYRPTKANLTIIVFAVSLVLSFWIHPVALPFFPAWTGDAAAYAPLLIAYISGFFQIVSGVVAYATGVYNILLAQVLEKLPLSKQLDKPLLQ